MKNNTSHSAHSTRAHAHSHGRLTRLAAFFAAAVLATSAAHADKYRETIYLTDGTYYCGYIAERDTQTGKIVIFADYCERKVPADLVNVESKEVMVEELNAEQQAWYFSKYSGLDRHTALRQQVKLGNLINKNNPDNKIEGVIIADNDYVNITYVSTNRTVKDVAMNQIVEIHYHGNDNPDSGIIDVYYVGGDYDRIEAKGTTEKNIFKRGYVVRTLEGEEKTIPQQDVIRIEKEARNASISVTDQAPTRDGISFLSGSAQLFGYIVERDFRSSTYTIVSEDGKRVQIPAKNIRAISTERLSHDEFAAEKGYDTPTTVTEPAPENTEPAPEVTEPAVTPENTEPAVTPEVTEPAVTPGEGAPDTSEEVTESVTNTPAGDPLAEETTSPEPTNNASNTFEALGGNVTTSSGSQDTDTTSDSHDFDTTSGFSNEEFERLGRNDSSSSATSTSTPSALPKGKIGVGGFTIDACPTLIDLAGEKGLTGVAPKDVVIESGNRITISGAETDIEIYRPTVDGALYRFKRGAGNVHVRHTTAPTNGGTNPYFSAESGQVYVIYSPSVNKGWLIRAL